MGLVDTQNVSRGTLSAALTRLDDHGGPAGVRAGTARVLLRCSLRHQASIQKYPGLDEAGVFRFMGGDGPNIPKDPL